MLAALCKLSPRVSLKAKMTSLYNNRISVGILVSVVSSLQVPTMMVQGFIQPITTPFFRTANTAPPTAGPFQTVLFGVILDDESDGDAYSPPEVSVDDGDDNYQPSASAVKYMPPDVSVEEDDNKSVASPKKYVKAPARASENSFYNMQDKSKSSTASSPRRRDSRRPSVAGGASWMDRNAEFSKIVPDDENVSNNNRRGGGERENSFQSRGGDDSQRRRGGHDFQQRGRGGDREMNRGPRSFTDRDNGDGRSNRTFRQDFRGTRIFVQGLPPQATWQDLKDHFRVAGEVVFASVSTDRVTGESKCCGVVQYETTEMAHHAIATMRNFPMDGFKLYVREDVQEGTEGKTLNSPPMKKGPTPPSTWLCANEENAGHLSDDERAAIRAIIKARDDARRRNKYDAADNMREELKQEFGVHVDDRLKMWWTTVDDVVPQAIRDAKGEGSWDAPKAWRQIPTTPENDACVNPDLVNGLLTQRDISRREKDFPTADSLLVEARESPDGELYLRIHDESRTWRIWTDEPPPRPVHHRVDSETSAAQQCVDLTREFAPHKLEEMETLLEKFPGREYNILKKLKQRYL